MGSLKQTILCLTAMLFAAQIARTQQYAYRPDLDEALSLDVPGVAVDSLSPHPHLLPKNISFMENGLWGENGLFRTTGLAAPLSIESRRSELKLRRGMLTAHFIGGLVTLGSMMTAAYYGQRVIDYNRRSDRQNHQLFVTTTIISYSATGALAVLSPPPLIRRDEISTISIHKALAWVHFTGMVITPILGASIGRRMTRSQTARFHQASAYVTTAALAASLIVLTF
jgi:hypothetical protein